MKKINLALLLVFTLLVLSACTNTQTQQAQQSGETELSTTDNTEHDTANDTEPEASASQELEDPVVEEEELLRALMWGDEGYMEVSYRPSGVHIYFEDEGYAFLEGVKSMYGEAVYFPEGDGESEPLYLHYRDEGTLVSSSEDPSAPGNFYYMDDEAQQQLSHKLLTNDGQPQQWLATQVLIYSTYWGEMTPESTYVQMTTTDQDGMLSLTIQGNGEWIFDGHSTELENGYEMRGFYAGYNITVRAENDLVHVFIHYIDHEYMDDRYISLKFEQSTGDGVYGNLDIDENAEPIVFVDAEMERLLSEFLGLETGEIYPEHMQLIDKLVIHGDSLWNGLTSEVHWAVRSTQGAITTLDDLVHCSNLKEIYIGNNQISDISALAELSQLEVVNLTTNAVSDLSALSGLEGLHTVILDQNMVSDASPLLGLENLVQLNLGSNNNYSFDDLQSISQMTGLEKLTLFHNDISDLSALSPLVALEYLDLDSNTFSDLSPLQDMQNLRDLSIEDNMNLSDISVLLEMESLEAVFVSDTQIVEQETSFVLHTSQYGPRG